LDWRPYASTVLRESGPGTARPYPPEPKP
jgi:hypothetical protein